MTVYTRVGRHHVPFWVLVAFAPFYLVYLVLALLWLTVVFSWKALAWLWYLVVSGVRWTLAREERSG